MSKARDLAKNSNVDSLVDVHLNTITAATSDYLSWNGSDYNWAAASGGGVTTYSTADDLPLTGNSAGDLAYVSGNNRMYVNNGSGWYSISLVNTNPTISSVEDASSNITPFSLATDGTATVITVTASDPEEVPLTYSYSVTSGSLTNGGGTTATVTQGTGANTNVFTITPSTNGDYGGTFTLTFTASDGINQATSPNSFSLAFYVANSSKTTLLLGASGNATDNQSFTNSGSEGTSISAVGDTYSTTFSPYRSGGHSTYFSSSGDYTRFDNSSDFTLDGDFTFECWYYYTGASGTHPSVFSISDGGNDGFATISHTRVLLRTSSATTIMDYSSFTLTSNTWSHLAITRSGNDIRFFINGVLETTVTSNLTISSGSSYGYVGKRVSNLGSAYNYGYVSDLRLVKGTAVYTSAFTPPTEPLTNITGTVLLTCHLPYVADGSSSARSITVYGSPSIEPFTPQDYLSYSEGTHGGSVYMDGSSDALLIDGLSTSMIGTSDFTLEFWIYTSAAASGTNDLVTIGAATGSTVGFHLYTTSSSFYIWNGSSNLIASTSGNWYPDQWMHIALVRDSGSLYLYVNGKLASSSSGIAFNHDIVLSSTYDHIYLGAYSTTSIQRYTPAAHYSDFRFETTARYTSDFTPPTSALTTGSAEVHAANESGSVFNKVQYADKISLYGTAQSSTVYTKYANSVTFDGTGDYIKIPNAWPVSGTGDFTVEFWFRHFALPSDFVSFFDSRTANTNNPLVWINTSNQVYYYANGANRIVGTTTLSSSTWYHVAVARSSGTTKLFLNGTQESSSYSDTHSYTKGELTIGARYAASGSNLYEFRGHIEDFRITNGLARYTANFTPPTASLKG